MMSSVFFHKVLGISKLKYCFIYTEKLAQQNNFYLLNATIFSSNILLSYLVLLILIILICFVTLKLALNPNQH